jgi:hypothetical protein
MERRDTERISRKSLKKLQPGILDIYIIKQFLRTFFSPGADTGDGGHLRLFREDRRFTEKQAPLKAMVFDYYLNFIPYFATPSSHRCSSSSR